MDYKYGTMDGWHGDEHLMPEDRYGNIIEEYEEEYENEYDKDEFGK